MAASPVDLKKAVERITDVVRGESMVKGRKMPPGLPLRADEFAIYRKGRGKYIRTLLSPRLPTHRTLCNP